MKARKVIRSFVPFVLFLVGCSVGIGKHQIVDEANLKQIQSGKTTKAQVESLLGLPERVELIDDGRETWLYRYVQNHSYLTDLDKDERYQDGTVTVEFGANGKVRRMGRGKI